jgi:hypothetical protein
VGIDFALVVIAEIFGRDVAEAVELRVEYRRGEALFSQGTSVAPVTHWAQAAARGLQGAVGGYEVGQARREEAAGQGELASILAGTGNADEKTKALVASPWGRDLGTQRSGA